MVRTLQPTHRKMSRLRVLAVAKINRPMVYLVSSFTTKWGLSALISWKVPFVCLGEYHDHGSEAISYLSSLGVGN